MEKKYLDLTGLQDVAGHVNTRLKTVTTMPLSADNGAVRLYVGNTTNTYIQGHIYQYDLANTEWKDITATSSSTSAYHAAGTKTVAELTSSLLVEANEGNVYNITDSGVTTADFIEGAGKPIRVGDNVGICEPTSGTYKFDLLSGFITIDSVPTDGSTNPVESNGVYDALAGKVNKSTYGGVIGSDGNVLNLNENIGILNSLETGLNLYTKTTNNPTKYGVSIIPTSGAVDGEFSNIIVNEFNAITSFAVGDYTKHEGKLYKCTTAHSSGVWNADHFSEVKLIDEVKNKEINIKANTELIKDTVGWSGKNLYDCKATTTTDEYGLTWTVDATDKNIITVSGTPTGFKAFPTYSNNVLPAGRYILSGILEDTTNVTLNYLGLRNGTTIVQELSKTLVGKEYHFDIPENVTYDNIYVTLKRNDNNVACSGTVRLMLRKANILDPTYEPYHDSVDKTIDTKALGLVKDAVGWSGKNLNKYPYNIESRGNGTVTITPNSDGSLSMTDGTTSASLSFAMQDRTHRDAIWLPIGKYTYSLEYEGTISGGTAKGYVGCTYNGAYLSLSGDVLFGKERTFEITADTQCDNKLADGSCLVSCYINLASNTTTSNVKVYPMLRKAEILDSTFEPYHKDVDGTINDTLREEKLTKSRNLLKIHINDVKATASGGAWSGNTYTKHDVAFTFSTNEQGYISDIDVDGTASALTQCDLTKLSGSQLKEMLGVSSQKILSGCPKQGSSSTYYLRIRTMNSVTFVTDTSAGVQFNPNDLVDSEIYRIFVDVDNGVSVSHLHFQPMIREALDGDRTFEPYYIPINENKATERVKDANGWSGKNLIPFPFAYKPNVQEKEGTTITPNEDGSITIVANPSTARSTFVIQERWNPSSMKGASEMVFLPNGDYILSGGNGNSNIEILVGCSTKGAGSAYNNLLTTYTGGKFTINGSDESNDGAYLQVAFRVASGATINETLHPMITRADVIDQTFEKGHRNVAYWATPRTEQVKLGVKNILENKAITQTVDTLTATINNDGTVRLVTSSATTQNNTIWLNTNVPLESGVSYILTGGNNINDDYLIEARGFNGNTDVKSLADVRTSLGVKFTPDYNGYDNIRVRIWVRSGMSTSGRTIYPMIRLATDPDNTYVPYAMTNKELTKGKVGWDEQAVLGAKNFWIIYSRKYYKADGITYTINDDNSVTANGTTSSNKVSVLRFFAVLPKGTYILSGGKSADNFVALYNRSTSQYYPNTTSTGGDTQPFTFNEDTEVGFTVRIQSKQTVNNLTFYPMVRLATDTDDTYVAPAFTNKKLTINMFPKDEQMILGAKNILPDVKSKTRTGVTYTVEDGVVNVNGTTPSSSSSNYMFAAVIG